MTDEEFLKLAQECGLVYGNYPEFPETLEQIIDFARDIERRTLEGAAEKCAEIDGGENEFSRAIRAMIKEKE